MVGVRLSGWLDGGCMIDGSGAVSEVEAAEVGWDETGWDGIRSASKDVQGRPRT